MTDPVIIKIRGVTYPSINAASRALNIPRRRIARALEKGELDEVGVNPIKNMINPKAVIADGVEYPSITAAANAYHTYPYSLLYMGLCGKINLKLKEPEK